MEQYLWFFMFVFAAVFVLVAVYFDDKNKTAASGN